MDRSADRQRRRKQKKDLIEAAPFGRLDQMLWKTARRRQKKHLITAASFGGLDQILRTTVQGAVSGGSITSQNRKQKIVKN